MAGKFKKGDSVVLKSGSPVMTVTGSPSSNGYDYSVTWFDSKQEQKFSAFDEDVLESNDGEE